MIGKELNFERTTGSFKTVLLVDDEGYIGRQFEANKDAYNRWTIFNESSDAILPYTSIIGRFIDTVNANFNSDLWRQILPSLNIAYKGDVERYGLQTFQFFLNLFPHHYTFDRKVEDGDLSEPVKFNNIALNSTYLVQKGTNSASNFGDTSVQYRTCAGGGIWSNILIPELNLVTASCSISLVFRIFPANIIDENDLINFSNVEYYYNVTIGFSQVNATSGDLTRCSIVVDKSTDTTTYNLIDKGIFTGVSANDISTDPYAPGGSTEPDGGNGSFDKSSDPVDVPQLPTLSALGTGFISIWNPSQTELNNLFGYLWSNAFDVDSFKKIFANPIDTILSFGIVPLVLHTSAPRALSIGNISTGINVTPVINQYYTIDCGTLYLDNFFDTYLEFEPYSTLEIFLPFCGCMALSSDDFYRRKKEYPGGGKINVKYNIDVLSGACVAFISCYDAEGQTTVTYEYNGNLLTQIPITGNDFSGMYNSILGIAGNITSGALHAATGNAAGILGDAVNAAHNVTSAKPSVNRSGSIGGAYGLLANRKPFLIRNIPREAVAGWQNLYQGYPSHITSAVKDLIGYTEFECVYIDNIPATDGELQEIERICKEGIVL